MSPWKTFREPEFWCGFVLALALAVAVAPLWAYGRSEHASRHQSSAAGEQAQGRPAALPVVGSGSSINSSDASQDHESVESHWPFYWPWSTEGWLAAFTLALVASTAGLWVETRNIRKDSERALRTLERAYLFPSFDLLREMPGPGGPAVAYLMNVHNFGKTPGMVRAYYVSTSYLPFMAEQPFYRVVGEFDLISGLDNVVPSNNEASPLREIGALKANHLLYGYIEYDDLWGKQHTTRFCVWVRGWALQETPPRLAYQPIGPRPWNQWN